MQDFQFRSKAVTQEAIITLGTTSTGRLATPPSLVQILSTVTAAHYHVLGREKHSLSARVFEGYKTEVNNGKEYIRPIVEIKLSPKIEDGGQLTQDNFLNLLKSYVTYLGNEFSQGAVYLQVNGETHKYDDGDF